MSSLEPFRRRIDELDAELMHLLGERFEICREVARHKHAHEIPMMQPDRIAEVHARQLLLADRAGVPAAFAARLTSLIVDATCEMEDAIIAAAEEGGG
jgi:chorismate mutase-like protein